MAKPSYQVGAIRKVDATTIDVELSVITSRGSFALEHRQLTVAAYTPAAVHTAIAAYVQAVEAEEAQAVADLAAVPVDPCASMVGARYDATKATPVALAPADKPADTGKAPPRKGV